MFLYTKYFETFPTNQFKLNKGSRFFQFSVVFSAWCGKKDLNKKKELIFEIHSKICQLENSFFRIMTRKTKKNR